MVRTGDHFCERVSRQIAPWIADFGIVSHAYLDRR